MTKPAVDVILAPIVTEKSYALHQQGQYTFRVGRQATKGQIAEALEELYEGVKVDRVNTIRTQGKIRRTRRRGVVGRTSASKKAIVTLQPGQKIEGLFGGV